MPAAPPTTSAAAGRTQLRGSRIAESSHPSSSSAAISVMEVSVDLQAHDRDPRAARPARALRAAAPRSSPLAPAPHSIAGDELLELLDRAVDEHLRGAVGAPERARDLAVVHAEREAHDQRLAAVVGQRLHAVEHAAELVAALDELLGRVRRRERGRLVDRRDGLRERSR